MIPNYLPDVWSPRFKRLGCCKNNNKKKSSDPLLMIQLCRNVIIKALWGAESSRNEACQGEQPTRSVPQVILHICNPSGSTLPPPLLAPYCGNDQEQFVTLAQPICCFCFSNGGWSGADWWVGWCWAGWGMRKWRVALTANYRSSVITGGQTLASVHGQTVQHTGHL